jgi:hypothetical protein
MENTFIHNDTSLHYFSGKELLSRLRLAAMTLGPERLGVAPDQLGLHSARSRATMAMYLAGVPVFTIMLLGRWSSDAFLRHIQKQVKELSSGVSDKMISHNNFFTIQHDSPKNLEQSHRPLNPFSQSNIGSNFKETIRPLASVFH